jgi:transcriptional regulator with XRE-family HTH domain
MVRHDKGPVPGMEQIGRIVLAHRRKAGLSRRELCELSSVGKTVLYDIEHGKPTIRIDSLVLVLNALNITIALDSPLMASLEV